MRITKNDEALSKMIVKILFSMFWFFCFAEASCIPESSKVTPKKDDKIYLKGCGGNPTFYFSKPFQVSTVYEVPNTVVLEKESPYQRPFQTHASSKIDLEGQELTASLENFRDLKIVDSTGRILARRKITGASSLFEIRLKGFPIAWAVGWHNNSREYHQEVDFTVFRVYFPILREGKVVIQERLLHGISQSKYQEAFKNFDKCVLVEGLQMGVGSSGCYYCFPNFILLDRKKGMGSIRDVKTLEQYIDIQKIDPLLFVFWLISIKDIARMRDYISKNFERIWGSIKLYKDLYKFEDFIEGEDFTKDHQSKKEACQGCLKKDTPFSVEEIYRIFDICFPIIRQQGYSCNLWLEDCVEGHIPKELNRF